MPMRRDEGDGVDLKRGSGVDRREGLIDTRHIGDDGASSCFKRIVECVGRVECRLTMEDGTLDWGFGRAAEEIHGEGKK